MKDRHRYQGCIHILLHPIQVICALRDQDKSKVTSQSRKKVQVFYTFKLNISYILKKKRKEKKSTFLFGYRARKLLLRSKESHTAPTLL